MSPSGYGPIAEAALSEAADHVGNPGSPLPRRQRAALLSLATAPATMALVAASRVQAAAHKQHEGEAGAF